MTPEDKSLLLKDLSTRLPHRTMIQVSDWTLLDTKLKPGHISRLMNEDLKLKPYLRPMSSMTEEEKKEMHNLLSPEGTVIYENDGIALPINHYGEFVPYEFMNRIIQYLLENHFDFMNLIPKGLAIEVTTENNPYKE